MGDPQKDVVLTEQDRETARLQMMVLRKLWEDALRAFLLSRRADSQPSSDEHKNFLDELRALDQIRARYKGGVVSPEFLSFKSMEKFPAKTAAAEDGKDKPSLFRRILHHPVTTGMAGVPAVAALTYQLGTMGHHLTRPGGGTFWERFDRGADIIHPLLPLLSTAPAIATAIARSAFPLEKKSMDMTSIFMDELNKLALHAPMSDWAHAVKYGIPAVGLAIGSGLLARHLVSRKRKKAERI